MKVPPARLEHIRRVAYLRRWPLIAVVVALTLTMGVSARTARGSHPSAARSTPPATGAIGSSRSVTQPRPPHPTPDPPKATPDPPPPTAAPPKTRAAPAPSDLFAPVGSVLLQVPTQSQLPDLPNGCEVTSLSMLLTAWGNPVDKELLAREQATDLTEPVFSKPGGGFYSIIRWGNPNRAFVGDVEGYGYGIYHGPLATLLNDKTHGHALDLSGRPFSEILAHLRRGTPVVAWTTSTFQPPTRWVTWTTPEGSFRGTQIEHSVLLVGYTRTKLIVNNPLTGRREQVSPAPFVASWQQMGRQALTFIR